MLKWWSSNLFIHIPTNSPRPPIHTHRHTEYLQTNSRLRKRRESLQKMQELSSSLPLLCFTKRLKRIPCDPGACGEAGRGRPLGLQRLSRPSLCSEAAPVRFSNCRVGAKSLPMPEEFPEQHSRAFSDCFETVPCLYFNTPLSGQLPPTGPASALNGKHVCQAQTRSPAPAPMGAAGLTQPQRQRLLELILISQSFSTRPLLCGARCWSWVSFPRSTPPFANFLLVLTAPSWPLLAPHPNPTLASPDNEPITAERWEFSFDLPPCQCLCLCSKDQLLEGEQYF